jgi:hypothetical protein
LIPFSIPFSQGPIQKLLREIEKEEKDNGRIFAFSTTPFKDARTASSPLTQDGISAHSINCVIC